MSYCRNQSVKEAELNYMSEMGKELRLLFHALWQDAASLNCAWSEYIELYGKGPDRLRLLNKSASSFFRTVQNVFWDNTLLNISRLTAPVRDYGRENITIQKLPSLVSAELQPLIESLISNAIEKSEFCQDWSNGNIALRGLELSLNKSSASSLETDSMEKVKGALLAIEDVLNATESHYTKSTTRFYKPAGDGAEKLLSVISKGLSKEGG